ncbi:hypothetical protein C8J57DRAFT_1247965 [Mycena rebaudengoi]|nr:hypothetical protein C8J57DRAFT_1247965 [Mycena rebaudengoi]
MLFNFNLAIISVLAVAGLVASEPLDEQRLRRLGRVVVDRQASCQDDFGCPGSQVCCTGLVKVLASDHVSNRALAQEVGARLSALEGSVTEASGSLGLRQVYKNVCSMT